MKEKGKDKLSITQGSYLPVTRQPQLLVYMVGTGGEWWLFRDPKERNMVLQMFGGSVSQPEWGFGLWDPGHLWKRAWGIDLLDEKGKVSQLLRDLKSKSGEKASSRKKQTDEQCGSQSNKTKKEVLAPCYLGGLRGSVSRMPGLLPLQRRKRGDTQGPRLGFHCVVWQTRRPWIWK